MGLVWVSSLATGLAVLTTRLRPVAVIALSGFWAWSAASWTHPALPVGWKNVDLEYGASLGRDSSLERQAGLARAVLAASLAGSQVVVLPESAIGFWTPTVEQAWKRALKRSDSVVIAGASAVVDGGYDNVLIAITGDGGKIIYRQRMPVPGAMWQPWRAWLGESGGARAHLFANPVVTIAKARVAPLICYEQLIVWPILQSMTRDPDLILAIGNGWWTEGTAIVGIQGASAIAWARLFAKPLVISFNT